MQKQTSYDDIRNVIEHLKCGRCYDKNPFYRQQKTKHAIIDISSNLTFFLTWWNASFGVYKFRPFSTT